MKYQVIDSEDLHKSGLDYTKIISGFCPGTFDYTLVEYDKKLSNITLLETDDKEIDFAKVHEVKLNV